MSYKEQIKSLMEEKARIGTQMQAKHKELSEKASQEQRALTEGEEGEFNKMEVRIEQINSEVERLKSIQSVENSLSQQEERAINDDGDYSNRHQSFDGEDFYNWIKTGIVKGIGYYPKYELVVATNADDNMNWQEQRALTEGSSNSGRFIVPETWNASLIEALRQNSTIREAGATVQNVGPTDVVHFPTLNDTETGEAVAAGGDATEGDPTFAEVTITPATVSSKYIDVKQALLARSPYGLMNRLPRIMGERIGRFSNLMYTRDQTNAAFGIVQDIAAGQTVTIAQGATNPTYETFVDLHQGVGSAYRRRGSFMVNTAVETRVMKLVDGNDRPLWVPSMREGAPATILNRPYYVNDDFSAYLETMGTTQSTVGLYGDFSQYHIADVSNIIVMREERAANLAIRLVAMMVTGGALVDAGTRPFTKLNKISG